MSCLRRSETLCEFITPMALMAKHEKWTRQFGEVERIDRINLLIDGRESFALAEPSGCNKLRSH